MAGSSTGRYISLHDSRIRIWHSRTTNPLSFSNHQLHTGQRLFFGFKSIKLILTIAPAARVCPPPSFEMRCASLHTSTSQRLRSEISTMPRCLSIQKQAISTPWIKSVDSTIPHNHLAHMPFEIKSSWDMKTIAILPEAMNSIWLNAVANWTLTVFPSIFWLKSVNDQIRFQQLCGQ